MGRAKPLAGQVGLGFKDPTPPKPPKKKTTSKRAKYGYKRSSFGLVIPPLLDAQGKPFACPCGRIRMMRHADGGIIVYDSQGKLGEATIHHILPPISATTLPKVCARFQAKGCAFHESTEST